MSGCSEFIWGFRAVLAQCSSTTKVCAASSTCMMVDGFGSPCTCTAYTETLYVSVTCVRSSAHANSIVVRPEGLWRISQHAIIITVPSVVVIDAAAREAAKMETIHSPGDQRLIQVKRCTSGRVQPLSFNFRCFGRLGRCTGRRGLDTPRSWRRSCWGTRQRGKKRWTVLVVLRARHARSAWCDLKKKLMELGCKRGRG